LQLAENFDVILGLLLFLLLDDLLKILLLLRLGHDLDSFGSLSDLVLLSTLRLFIIIVCHVVEWLLVSLDVDFKSVESILCPRPNALLKELDTRLFEEVLDGRLCNCAIVSQSVSFDPSLHVLECVVSPKDCILWELSDPLN